MQSNLKTLREQKNLTQSELAEKSGLSLRTIQRIEAGNIPKGFTLKAITNALEIEPEKLFVIDEQNPKIDRAKLINISALSGLIIPFGSIIFPLILTYKTKDSTNKRIGEKYRRYSYYSDSDSFCFNDHFAVRSESNFNKISTFSYSVDSIFFYKTIHYYQKWN